MLWHGGQEILAVVTAVILSSPPQIDLPLQTIAINSRVMDVAYSVDPSALPLSTVELWFTQDEAKIWKRYGLDSDLRSPIRFQVDLDGLYGVFVVIGNRAGSSSGPPQQGQSPHQWILVDSSIPLVQIKQVRLQSGGVGGAETLLVSWSAYDTNLSKHPVTLYYQTREQPGWQLLMTDVGNISRLDWPIPQQISGQLQVKIEVTDLAGNISSDVSQTVVVPSRGAPREPEPAAANTGGGVDPVGQAAPELPQENDPTRIQKARELYELALWHKQRADYALAIERLLESMNYDPTLSTAAYELAEIYYSQGDYQGALDIHQKQLVDAPNDPLALRGSALALVAMGKYPEALKHLERILKNDSGDAETWLNAGDVFLWMGNRKRARTYWQRAEDLSPRDSLVHEKADKRLKRYAEGP